MSRCIDADALSKKLLEELHNRSMQGFGKGLMIANSCVINAPTIEPEPHWISCSERLPEDKKYVLVTDYGETDIGRRFGGRWLDYYGDKLKDVTAWMPLPEPYREGE